MMATELRALLDDVTAEHGDALVNVFVHRPERGMTGIKSAHFLADEHAASGVRVIRIDLMG